MRVECVPFVSSDDCMGLLDSFLHDLEALDHQETAKDAPAPKVKPKKRRLDGDNDTTTKSKKKKEQTTYFKRKQELQTLRQQDQVLGAQLLMLEMHRKAQEALTEGKESEWKVESQLEKKLLLAAQGENEQVKSKLQSYLNKAEEIKTMLLATESVRTEFLRRLETSHSLSVELGAAQQLHLGKTPLFNMLEGKAEARFHKLSASFCAMPQSMSVDQDSYDHASGEVEVKRMRLLPFDLDAVFSAAWAIISTGRFPDGHNYRVSRQSRDAFAVTATTTVQLEDGGVIRINSHAVIKTFLIPSGFVNLLEMRSEWLATLPNSETWSHLAWERGCFLTRKYSVKGETAPGLSHMSFSMQTQPIDSTQHTSHYPSAKPTTVHDIVDPNFCQLCRARDQFMENATFDVIRAQRQV